MSGWAFKIIALVISWGPEPGGFETCGEVFDGLPEEWGGGRGVDEEGFGGRGKASFSIRAQVR